MSPTLGGADADEPEASEEVDAEDDDDDDVASSAEPLWV